MIKNAIELYLMYKESSNIDWGTCRKEHLLGGKVQSSFSLTPHEESAKNDVEKICKEGALNLQIYTLGERSGKFKARARAIRNPALIVYHPDSKQLKIRDITDYLSYEELFDFIYGLES